MTELVLSYLKADTNNGRKYEAALAEIYTELDQQGQSLNIETLLSNVEEKIRIIGKGTLNDLTKDEFIAIGEKIREEIQKMSAFIQVFGEKRVHLFNMTLQNGYAMRTENVL